MAKIKHTKTELKAQREALDRYERFLPMLQLKKQQLQAEIQRIDAEVDVRESRMEAIARDMQRWVALMSDPLDLTQFVRMESIKLGEGNIAGVAIPVFEEAQMTVESYDLFETPLWVDDAVEALSERISLQVEANVLREQSRLITEELRVTNQRVNLFDKVKIPECRENIRVIKIFLGDEQTASVARAKIAKGRSPEPEQEEQAA